MLISISMQGLQMLKRSLKSRLKTLISVGLISRPTLIKVLIGARCTIQMSALMLSQCLNVFDCFLDTERDSK